jgi:hypothetical protein
MISEPRGLPHLHEEIEAVVNHVSHERFRVVIAQLTGRVHVLQFLRKQKSCAIFFATDSSMIA